MAPVLGLATALTLLAPALAFAQPAPAAAAQPGAPTLNAATAAAVQQRIDALKSRLGITAAQEPAWDAFAATMRDNAAKSDALFAQRTASAATMNAVDNMHSYAAITLAYAEDTEKLASAFDTLYASLTDAQKKTADELFRQQAATAGKPAPR
jgi:hypothetical protein